MASVSFTFNLDPVASTAQQGAASGATESTAAIGAKYDIVQSSVQSTAQSNAHLSGVASPACADGGCFVVHGEGPGVTTLSVGEEDGGTDGFITLPVVDGSLFLEPPVTDFAGADYQVTTLAIGEEDGGAAVASSEIGGSSSAAEISAVEPGFTMEPIYDSQPAPLSAAPQVAAAPAGTIQTTPIQTTPIYTPTPKPAATGATIDSIQTATARSPLPPVQTVPITQPATTQTELAGSSFPLPGVKPDVTFASVGAEGSSVVGAGGASDTNLVSVGDYDAYLESMGKSGSSTAVAGNVTPDQSSQAVYAPPPLAPLEPFLSSTEVAGNVTTAQSSQAVYAPPPLAPLEPFVLPPVSADTVTITYSPPPLAPDVVAPTRVEVVLQPVTTSPSTVSAPDTVVSPRMKPATFTTPGPATLPPIQTVPIETVPIQTDVFVPSTSVVSPQTPVSTEIGGTFTTIDTPLPAGKPEAANAEAPRLSDDDFRISTLALGEEEAGGG